MNISSSSAMKLLDDPDLFLGLSNPDWLDVLRSATKRLYDWRVNVITDDTASPAAGDQLLPELFINGFDTEQIYQQIELLNEHAVDRHQRHIAALTSDRLAIPAATEGLKDKKESHNSLTMSSLKKMKKTNSKDSRSKKQVRFEASDVEASNDDESELNEDEDTRNDNMSTTAQKKFGRVDSRDKTSSDRKAATGDVAKQVMASEEEEEEDESEEEKELKALLDKVTGSKNAADHDGSDSELSGLASDDDDDDDEEYDEKNKSDGSSDDKSTDSDSSVSKLKKKLHSMNERAHEKNKKQIRQQVSRPVFRKSVVDDRFFKLSQMEAFLNEQDLKEQREQNGRKKRSGDESEDVDDDEEEEEDELADDDKNEPAAFMYNDFFDPPEDGGDIGKDGDDKDDNEVEKLDDDDDDDDMDHDGADDSIDDDKDMESIGDDSDDDDGDEDEDGHKPQTTSGKSGGQTTVSEAKKSSFEWRQEKLRQKISELEDSNLRPKSWQMSGEVLAAARPENSLLQENVDFEFMTRQAPVITETTTKKLEDLILQRIKDKAWDDVERKARPTDKMVTYSKRVVLDQEKNKMSLSQIYEQQFLKQSQKSDGGDDDNGEKLDPKQTEIKSMMQSLFTKLDALANFHYTPKPVIHDVKIVSNVPALSLEEVVPSAVSDAALLAPEEVESKSRRELIGQSEMTAVDRHRARRLKKKHQRDKKFRREKLDKLKEGGKGGSKSVATVVGDSSMSNPRDIGAGNLNKSLKRLKHGKMKDMMVDRKSGSGGGGGKGAKLEKSKKGGKQLITQNPKPKKAKLSR